MSVLSNRIGKGRSHGNLKILLKKKRHDNCWTEVRYLRSRPTTSAGWTLGPGLGNKIGIWLLGKKYVLVIFYLGFSFLLTLLDTKIHTTQVKHDVLCVVISYRKFKIKKIQKRSDIIARGKE